MAAFSDAYCRAVGVERAVYFSPLATYGRIAVNKRTGRGGAMVQDCLHEHIQRGVLPSDNGPDWIGDQTTIFQHTMRDTAGRVQRPDPLPDGWETTAGHFVIEEAYQVHGSDKLAILSGLCEGWPYATGRAGHAIKYDLPVWDGRYYIGYQDSYHRYLFDSERMWSGGYFIRSVSHNVLDPSKPVGEQVR